jgi:hypothetical protein
MVLNSSEMSGVNRVFITTKGVVTTAARPPYNDPTGIVSHGSQYLLKTCFAAKTKGKRISRIHLIFENK